MQTSTGRIKKAQKVVIYGTGGIGKSTFASNAQGHLFDDIEGSTYELDVRRVNPRTLSYTALKKNIEFLKHTPNFCQTYVIDTIDAAEILIKTYLTSRDGKDGIEGYGYGKGYTYLEEEFARFLDMLQELVDVGINVLIIAHAEIAKFDQPDEMGSYNRYEIKLEKKTAALLKEWADAVIFANYKTFVVNIDDRGAAKGKNRATGGTERVMYTEHRAAWDAKNRHGLKSELPFRFEEIAHIFYSPQIDTPKETPKETKSMARSSVSFWKHKGNGVAIKVDQIETEEELTKLKEDCFEINQKDYEEWLYIQDNPIKGAEDSEIPDIEPKQKTDPMIDFGKVREQKETLNPLIKKALRDLMVANNVTEQEIMKVVEAKGYYPKGTPITNYEEKFIDGVLIAAWKQVFDTIKLSRFTAENGTEI